ncbi:hypothetical protein DFA_09505 [Cavenderia fasciculata]|uniref:Pseudouridine synthase RsuA/RluA-like domain-containing protein n=1 Tax=Cavenderia fasciculata TaxID=261658 RepID=F4Q7T6_CACFS|nr:uncharacterized protein DFA_09505 [Cavenderia fasciculata]EGG15836.1 hypothetical protein DFA_09505 [Cavenderia fasciculata]|eukprot:XP_004352161.1 hypothetical protein DFA_09505 [Cavenderia fasciculata]
MNSNNCYFVLFFFMSLIKLYKGIKIPLYINSTRNVETVALIDILYDHFKQTIPRSHLVDVINIGGVYCRHATPKPTVLPNGRIRYHPHTLPNPHRVTDQNYSLEPQSLVKLYLFPRHNTTIHLNNNNNNNNNSNNNNNNNGLNIIHDNESFMVVDKPHGINVGPLIDNLKNNLSWMVRQQQQQSIDTPIYNPHRIDFPTRGLCLLVKKSDEIHRFNQLFKDRTIKKRYRVFIYENQNDKDKEIEKDGEEKEKLRVGRYIHYMKPSKSTIKQLSLDKVDGWHDCGTEIDYLKTDFTKNVYMDDRDIGKGDKRRPHRRIQLKTVDVELITGRTHQIRSQMSFMGYPIIGDKMYGGKSLNEIANEKEESKDKVVADGMSLDSRDYDGSLVSSVIGLMAYQLSFKCPITKIDYLFSLFPGSK